MKTILLCGGFGSRLGELTNLIPKPLVQICNKPIVCHIMDYYYSFGFKDFILATGYKSNEFKKFFLKKKFQYNVKLFYTGLHTQTGGRLKKCKKFLSVGEDFMLTYGDALSSHNLKKLLDFHKKKKKIATVTAVHPPVRFGEIKFKNNQVIFFNEKIQLKNNWISGGFFVFNYKIFDYLDKTDSMFERKPITKLVKKKQLSCFPHDGLWQCMDTLRDKQILEEMVKSHRFKYTK